MGLGKYRTRFSAKGLGNLEVREVSPSAGTEFLNAGYLGEEGTEVGEVYEQELHRDETGAVANVDNHSRLVTLATNLKQVGLDEINLIRDAKDKIHALRYSGMVNPDLFQYYCMEQARINPNLTRGFKPGKNPLPFRATALRQDDSSFAIPELYVAETAGKIRTENLQLWVSPRHGYTSETAKLLDISGWARHGTLNSDFAAIWQQTTNPAEFLRFDGVNDQCDFGNIITMNSTDDFLFELWVRIQAANGVTVYCMGKRAGIVAENVGWMILRHSVNNNMRFYIGDGSASGVVIASATTLQNIWTHVAFAIDRNGNGQAYINGVASGDAVAVSGVGNSSESANLYLGRVAATFGQIDMGDVRAYNFGAGGLPSDIATIIANHFAAERGYYGV